MNIKCPNCNIIEIVGVKLKTLERCNLCDDVFCVVCFDKHSYIHKAYRTFLTKDELEKYKVKEDEN